jgi:peptidyl-prolyl cis-trans isomerase SurA
MRICLPIRMRNTLLPAGACALALIAAAPAQPQSEGTQSAPVVLDRVVAVVNQRVILASDLDNEIRLSVLDPGSAGLSPLTRQHALEQIIRRSLIEQQIRQEDAQAAEPTQAEVDARLAELRKELPICVQEQCATDAGWRRMLAAHNLTPERVQAYLRYQLEILRFIEQRFRQGIRISPEQIADYYNKSLLPEYRPGDAVPTLQQVSPRIEEILLEQQVNMLFDNWLNNLRQQGDVEILDPALEMPGQTSSGGNSQ